ncbi:MAG TPA: LamG domain-containing protein, partial [Lacibacter sp.]|nr:LamG domain-containing protein [Lacibacter sp.]
MKKLLLFSFFSLFIIFSLSAQTNYAINMNGSSNSYANLGTVNPTNNFSTGLTIECWVKWGAFNTWSRLIDMGNGSGSDNLLFANEGTTNALRFEVYKGASQQGISGPANLVTGRWYHVAVTQNGSGVTTLYVDGVAVATTTL